MMEYSVEFMIFAIAAAFLGLAIYKSRKAGHPELPWEKLRPILSETFIRINKVQAAKKLGYQELENYAVQIIMIEIKRIGFLTEVEKSLITEELVRSIVSPRLKEIYKEKSE